MVVNIELSRLERIRKILEDQHGTLLTSDLVKFNIPRTYLSILEQKGEIERVSRGVYGLTASIEDEMFGFQARYKSSIYSVQQINESLKRCVSKKDRNIDLLYSYARQFRVQKIVREYVEVLL